MNQIERFSRFLSLKKQCASEEEYRAIIKLSAQDGIITGGRANMAIIVFELVMIFSTLVWNDWSLHRRLYFAGYLFLLFCSLGVFASVRYVKADLNAHYMATRRIEIYYAVALMLWAVYMTFVENYYNQGFTALILITVLVTIPIVTFLEPLWYLLLHFFGSISVFFVIFTMTEYGRFGNTVNFLVFSIISLISGLSFFQIRKNAYSRQVALFEMANRDQLSTLYNRQMLARVSPEIWEKCRQKELPLCCVLCDIDDFKRINDTHGHAAGDQWIQAIAAILKDACDTNGGSCFRYGGEEFLLIFPGLSAKEAVALVESVQQRIKTVPSAAPAPLAVTLSFGIYCTTPRTCNSEIEKCFSQADRLMYKAKQCGKNQYCVLQDG